MSTDLTARPIHLGLGGAAEAEPPFTGGKEWYEAYVARHDGDGDEGRLVALHTFEKPWDMWERHPAGDEVVLCTTGAMVLHLEAAEGVESVTLGPNEYAIVPAGTWHTADVEAAATALFITPGRGTQHRPR